MNILRDVPLDVRRAVRSLRRSPIVTTAAIISIGLGAAAATTVFSIVDAALFRPPPFERAADLAVLFMTRARPAESPVKERWSWPRFRALAATQQSWKSRFGGESMIGRKVTLNGVCFRRASKGSRGARHSGCPRRWPRA